MAARSRRLAAIMFTDMVGYTALVQADEATALAVLERHNQFVRLVLPKYRGREVKTAGDAFLVEFESALDAVQCAIELQHILHHYNGSASEGWQIAIRIGIHVGDVVETGGDVLGDAVNVASRIEPLAEPEGIRLTQQVYDQVHTKISRPLVALPPQRLKNIREPVTVYRVVPTWDESGGGRDRGPERSGHHLAVLPLANISPDPGDEYFADGLTEELISTLSQVRDLNVIARTSIVPYKTAPKSVAQVGAELGVDTVLEGSVRKAGNRLRITLQLIDVASQGHIWATSYNREVGDVFAVQSDIAERTADALRLELTGAGDRAEGRRPTSNLEAYDLYLRGLAASRKDDHAGYDEAVRCFEQATQLDPTFADAYATWANLYVAVAGDSVAFKEVIPKARSLIARALELDPESSDAHSALANITFQADHDWARAESEFDLAIALNPSNAVAHRFRALMLLALQRYDEAREATRRTMRLDPGGHDRRILGWIGVLTGNAEEGLSPWGEQGEADRAEPGFHIYLGLTLMAVGRASDAAKEADFPTTGAGPSELFDHALLAALVGRPDEARATIARAERGESLDYTSPSHLSMLYGALGDRSKAMDLLESDYREGERILWLVYRGPWYDGMRHDPRFIALLGRYGLPTHSPSTAQLNEEHGARVARSR